MNGDCNYASREKGRSQGMVTSMCRDLDIWRTLTGPGRGEQGQRLRGLVKWARLYKKEEEGKVQLSE